MSITTIGEKFLDDLSMLYDAEYQFLAGQQEMLMQAQSQVLRQMLEEHILQTRQQIANLDQIFAIMGTTPLRGSSHVAQALVSEASTKIQSTRTNPGLVDCVIANAAEKVEHFEVACYRMMAADAEQMGQPDLLQMLQVNLAQEEYAAAKIEEHYPDLLQLAIANQKLDRAVGDGSSIIG